MWNPFKKTRKVYNLGIDIGTSSIKIVELLHDGSNIKLNNYAQFFAKGDYINTRSGSFNILDSQITNILKQMFLDAGFVAKNAVLALPVFSSFSTLITLPYMSKDELSSAVSFEIRKYIPVPIKEVQYDWMRVASLSNEKQTKILTVAIPNEIVERYNKIAQMTNINLSTMELETFSAARALIPKTHSGVTAILDIGARNTNVSIVDNGIVIMHHNIDSGGTHITQSLARGMLVDTKRAEELKRSNGIESNDQHLAELIKTPIDKILTEIQQVLENYIQEGGASAVELILIGGNAQIPGLVGYIKEFLKIEVKIGDPFINIEVPYALKAKLQDIGHSLAVAVGSALRK